MYNTKINIGPLMILGLILIAPPALFLNYSMAENTGGQTSQARARPAFARVEPKNICMLTDTVSNREQLPVTINGKQYYGCCHICEAKLKEDPASRLAIDPVSGNLVDKSSAVIGAAPDGKVYYFESAEDLTAFGKSPDQ